VFNSNKLEKYWGDALLKATYLINRIPNSSIGYKTPFEIMHGVKSPYAHLKVFGCLCYASTLKKNLDKLKLGLKLVFS